MMQSVAESLKFAATDPNTKVTILTAADPYYCAGVDLSGSLKLMHPKKLHEAIAKVYCLCILNYHLEKNHYI